VIEHDPDNSEILREVYRVLKPNGYSYVSTVAMEWYRVWTTRGEGLKLDTYAPPYLFQALHRYSSTPRTLQEISAPPILPTTSSISYTSL